MDTSQECASGKDLTSCIAATVDAYPICEQVVRFLVKNQSAMDTVKGIASWWLGCDEVAAQDALDRLVSCGVLRTHTLTAGTVYSLTRNPEVRAWLQAAYANGQRLRPRRPAGGTSRRKLG